MSSCCCCEKWNLILSKGVDWILNIQRNASITRYFCWNYFILPVLFEILAILNPAIQQPSLQWLCWNLLFSLAIVVSLRGLMLHGRACAGFLQRYAIERGIWESLCFLKSPRSPFAQGKQMGHQFCHLFTTN